MKATTPSLGLTVLRVVVGIVFLVHGYQKLFQMGPHKVAGFFHMSGIPLPLVSAAIVTLVEFVGGILLVLGVATRVAAALNAIDMAVAILVVHLKHGFYNQNMGFEYPLVMLAATLCLALAGGGAFSLKSS
ncbi:MAG TPA: DoxX family protein [Terriglobales bacterium]|nr:DoxX family protein [Terriglobales bacterium]